MNQDEDTKLTNRITMMVMKDQITFEQAQRAFRNPKAFFEAEKAKTLRRDLVTGNAWPHNYRWVGKIKTARMIVAYCWTTKRNTTGYFLGWREVYDGTNIKARDQFVARKSKKRLKELQERRTAALIEKGAVSLKP